MTTATTTIGKELEKKKKAYDTQRNELNRVQEFLENNKISLRKFHKDYSDKHDKEMTYQAFYWRWTECKFDTTQIKFISALVEKIKKEIESIYACDKSDNRKYCFKNTAGLFLVDNGNNDYAFTKDKNSAMVVTGEKEATKMKKKLYKYKLIIDEISSVV